MIGLLPRAKSCKDLQKSNPRSPIAARTGDIVKRYYHLHDQDAPTVYAEARGGAAASCGRLTAGRDNEPKKRGMDASFGTVIGTVTVPNEFSFVATAYRVLPSVIPAKNEAEREGLSRLVLKQASCGPR